MCSYYYNVILRSVDWCGAAVLYGLLTFSRRHPEAIPSTADSAKRIGSASPRHIGVLRLSQSQHVSPLRSPTFKLSHADWLGRPGYAGGHRMT